MNDAENVPTYGENYIEKSIKRNEKKESKTGL
jgi:hypothetical protein